MLFCCILVCIIQIFCNCFTSCDSVLVLLLYLSETNSMTHQCCMTCHLVLFRLATIALLPVTCLTSPTTLRVLHKLRTGLLATGVCSLFEQDKSLASPPPAACPPPVQWLLLHLPLDCHPPSEVMLSFLWEPCGCPSGSSTAGAMLNWLIFLAAQAMCWLFRFFPTYLGWRLSWLLLIPAFGGGSYGQYVPLQHPWLTFCGSCSAARFPLPSQ